MSSTRWREVNRSEDSFFFDPSAVCVPLATSPNSAIDEYYATAADVLARTRDPTIGSDDFMLRLLLLGLVSATENYFRRVLAGMVASCPLVRRHAARQVIALGAHDYYDEADIGYALLEHQSLSGSEEIRKATSAVLGFNVQPLSSVGSALTEFDRVCHLRHAAVHSDGEISARNALAIGVSGYPRPCVVLSPFTFQTLVGTCHNSVRAYNREIFRLTIDRWIDRGLLSSTWAADRRYFRPVYVLLRSVVDGLGYKSAYQAYKAILRDTE